MDKIVVVDIDGTGGSAAAARAAADIRGGIAAEREIRGRREAAVTAAAADRLSDDAIGHRAIRRQRAPGVVGNDDLSAGAARAAGAADRIRFGCGGRRAAGADREPAVAAAATDGLRHDADAFIAARRDGAAVRNGLLGRIAGEATDAGDFTGDRVLASAAIR